MPWRRVLSDLAGAAGREEARQTWRALRDLARMGERLTSAQAVVLVLAPEPARLLDLSDCLIGPQALIDGVLPVARDLMAGFTRDPGADSPPDSGVPLITDRLSDNGGPILARALFQKDGSCAGALAVQLAPPGADPAAEAPLDAGAHALELLGTVAETLLNDRLRQLEVQHALVACRSEMKALRQMSERDPLTGLVNTAVFETQGRALLTGDGPAALLVLLDIDHFKAVNDLYGHQFGDRCLKTVANAVRLAMPAGAVVGRLGGDEFGVILPLEACGGDGGLQTLLTELRSAILRATAPLDKPGLGEVSIGAARFPDDATDYHHLYNRADLALYASKSMGRGTVTLYSSEIGDRFDYSELAKNFGAACRSGQVVPYFQPMVDLTTGRARVFEVLCRWDNPRHGVMAPETFSSIFSDHEVATHLTRHMGREAIRVFAQARRGLDLGAKLSLNLTYFDLLDRAFIADLDRVLAEHDMHWTQMVIEVQETVALDEGGGQVFRSLSEMRRRGAEIALDDYGTGFGALKHLRNWPIDMVKIDRAFVEEICGSARDRAIIGAILRLTRDLGLRVVAEGVERPDQAAMLADMGCDMGQGYGLGRPMDPDSLLALAGPGEAGSADRPRRDPAPPRRDEEA